MELHTERKFLKDLKGLCLWFVARLVPLMDCHVLGKHQILLGNAFRKKAVLN